MQNEGNGFAFDPANCNVAVAGKNFPAFTARYPDQDRRQQPRTHRDSRTGESNGHRQLLRRRLAGYYAHTSFYLTSGTGGLQEAITNSRVLAGGPNTILLNAEWYQLVSRKILATVIASVTGGSGFGLFDVTTTPYSYYQWNGSQFVAVSSQASLLRPGIVVQQQRLLFVERDFIADRSGAEHQPIDPTDAGRAAGREQRLDGCG